ncbi:MAG: serine/threonine-protein kinase [Planctomycetota bacterium]|nr:serine/threonine-protein kinase [Planctomycetota bacterium]
MAMDENETQAYVLLSWEWLPEQIITIAKQRLPRYPDKDLCQFLVDFGHLDDEQATQVRDAVHKAVEEQEAQEKAQEEDRIGTKVVDPRDSNKLVAVPDQGMTFEKFDVIETLASGGYGLVYKAKHKESGRLCAVKVLLDQGWDAEEYEKIRGRFSREAFTLSELAHPNIVRGVACGTENGSPYLAMELISGSNLKDSVDQSYGSGAQPDFDWLIGIFKEVARALLFCHEKGVIHRDVKPSNIVIEEDSHRPVLIDFGMVKADREKLSKSWYTNLSMPGEVVGTPAFMAPEQICATGTYGDISEETDVWGLGATLFYCLAGVTPYRERTATSTFIALLSKDPERLRTYQATISEEVDQLVSDCLQRDSTKRPTMAEFLSRLEALK